MRSRKHARDRPMIADSATKDEPQPDLAEMDRLLGRLMFPVRNGDNPPGMLVPPVGLAETETEIVVRAAVPGFVAKELQVELQGDLLRMCAEHIEESNDATSRKTLRNEWRREVRMPVAVNGAKASAVCRNGVLEVRLPKMVVK